MRWFSRRSERWAVRAVALAALLGLLVPSLAGGVTAQEEAAPGETPWYVDDQGPAVPGGTVRFLLYEDPNDLNPLGGANGNALQVTSAIVEGLAENGPDGTFVPVLAAELPTLENGGVSADLKTVTWKLKDGVTWSDGTPFTSADVRHTWEAGRDATNGSTVSGGYEVITDVQTPDPLTAVLTYSEFSAGYLDAFPYVVPAHATGAPADMASWGWSRSPIGTGPFKLEEWATGEYVRLVRNERYRGAAEGKPYLDGLTFLVVPDEAARAALMVEEDAEVMLWAGTEATNQIEEAGVGASRTAPGIWVVEMHFNLSKPYDGDPGVAPAHPALGDLRVRQAITMAVDRERIRTEFLADSTTYAIDSPLAVGWMACEVEPFAFDPEAARALLEEAGWRDEDGDGVRESHGVAGVEDGTALSFTMNGYTGFDALDLIQLAVQEDLAAVGIEAAIENQDFAVIFGTWEDGGPRMVGDYDVLLFDDGFAAEPGGKIENRYHPASVPSEATPGGLNYERWVRQDVGRWIDAANASPDLAVRRENFCNVATAIREDIPVFPILQFNEGSAYSLRLHGFTVSTWEWATWDSESWWVEQ